MSWYTYVVECSDGTFYTGVTTDVERRINEHNEDDRLASRYVRGRRPVRLYWHSVPSQKAEAYRLERQIKQMSHEEKTHIAENMVELGGMNENSQRIR
jgi:putative endonuclease